MRKQTRLAQRKTRLRLGRGSRAKDAETLWRARNAFLVAVVKVEPETYSVLLNDSGDPPDVAGVVRYWQQRFNLLDDWLADIAEQTYRAAYLRRRQGMARWHINSDRPRHPFVMPTHRRNHRAGHHVNLPPALRWWNDTEETWPEFLRRAVAALNAEHQRMEQESTLPATKTKSPEHFLWLARYQVLNESGQGIAATLPDEHPEKCRGVEERARAVQDAIVQTKDLIGLTLRDDPYRTPKKL